MENFLHAVTRLNIDRFRVFGPDETQSNRLEAVYEAGNQHTKWLEKCPARVPTRSSASVPDSFMIISRQSHFLTI